MRLSYLEKILSARIKLFYGKTTPLRIAHFITTRCNLKCKFCKCHTMKYNEMTTDEIKVSMQLFKKLGTFAWGFTGGEPFLREDIAELFQFAKKLNLFTSVVTNGTLLDKIDKVNPKHIDFIMVSFEGKEKRTMEIRGNKYVQAVYDTIEYLANRKINLCLSSTLDENSFEDICYTIEYAKSKNIFCSFQPIFNFLTQQEDRKYLDNPIALTGLCNNIDYLIQRKKKGDPIWNSLDYLYWVKNYGKVSLFYCYAGKLYATLMPDGTLRRCPVYGNERYSGNFKKDFCELNKEPHYCYCYPWCHIEYSLNFSLKLRTVLNTLNRL
ncbi:MAG: radical SAM protein [Desulfobacterales bacterium]|nr:radical SAM protein [Desulfobacterales bacterium]